jgi:hypothetical protein
MIAQSPIFASDEAHASQTASETERLLEGGLERWIAQISRLQLISQRIRLAGREVCGAFLTPILGAAVLDARETPPPIDSVISRRFGNLDALYVTSVFPGMAAERAGLLPGDAVVRIGYHAADEEDDFYSPYVEMNQELVLEVDRQGERLTLPIERDEGCAFRARLTVSEEVNAYATREAGEPFEAESKWRRRIPLNEFTTALLREFQDDRTIAIVVGHELAHDIDMHRSRHRRFTRQARIEERADYIGIYLAVMAGYSLSPDDADFWLEMRRNVNYLNLRGSHPATPERVIAFRKTLEEIEDKRRRGEAITLEVR